MRTFRAGNLEVMRKDLDYPDFSLKMSYEEIENLELGKYSEEGWRIPTHSEIKYLYKVVNCASYNRIEWNSQKWCIGKFGDESYWAISAATDSFVLFDFLGGSIESWSKGRLRLVRDIE
jgi:hypothetical protein